MNVSKTYTVTPPVFKAFTLELHITSAEELEALAFQVGVTAKGGRRTQAQLEACDRVVETFRAALQPDLEGVSAE